MTWWIECSIRLACRFSSNSTNDAAGEFWRDVMMARESERIRLDNGQYGAWWFRFHQKSYDVVYSADWTSARARFHHLAFSPDSREDILNAAFDPRPGFASGRVE